MWHFCIVVLVAGLLGVSSGGALDSASLDSASVDSASLDSASLAKPDFTVYHTMEATFASIAQIVESSSDMSLETRVRESMDKEGTAYKTSMHIVTYDTGGWDSPGGSENSTDSTLRVLVNFGEHGREVITTEVAISFLTALASPDVRTAVLSKFSLSHLVTPLSALLSRTVIKVIPMENPNGRALVEDGHLCERKNGRGVDPNRNWGVDWGKKEPDYDPNEEYPGEFPFSEPESQLLKELTVEFRPDMFLNIHSGMEAMFVPWDHQLGISYGPDVNATLGMLESINTEFCGGRCAVGSGGKNVGYLAHGTVTDYMHKVLKVPISSTWEIYGDLEADFNDCWRMFNPIGVEEKDAVVDRWVGSLLYALWYGLGERHPVGQRKRAPTRLGSLEDHSGDHDGEEQMFVVYALLVPVVAAIVIGARSMRRKRAHRKRTITLPVLSHQSNGIYI